MNVIVWLGGFEEPQDSNRHIGMDNWGIDRLDPCTQDKAREALDLADHLRRYWDYLSSSPTDLMRAPSYETAETSGSAYLGPIIENLL